MNYSEFLRGKSQANAPTLFDMDDVLTEEEIEV